MKPVFIPLLNNGSGDVKALFMDSFVRGFGGRPVHLQTTGDSHPDRARNRVAADFLESDCEHLLFIDADIIFRPEDIERLFESDEPILGGIYPKKSVETSLCLTTLPDYVQGEHERYLPVARIGTGFLRIHRSVFEAMKAVSPRYTNHGRDEWAFFRSGVRVPESLEWLSEDWWFCDEARDLGFRVVLDTTIQVRHEGFAVYPIELPKVA